MKEDLMAEATKHPPLPPDRVRDKPRRLGRCMRATEYSHAVGAINAVYPDAIEIAGFLSSASAKGMGMFAELCMLVDAGYVWTFGLIVLADRSGTPSAGSSPSRSMQ